MRPLALVLCLAHTASAAPPLVAVEARLGGGLAAGGGSGQMIWRSAPMTLGVLGELTLHDRPWTTVYVGAFGEFVDRLGLGLVAGVRVRPGLGGLRLGIGADAAIVPYTLLGISAEAGYCFKVNQKGRIHLCADIQGVMFFVGDDLPDGRVAGQLNVLAGVNFDAM